MCRFSTSFFSGFGLDFGGSWASKMEPSWPEIDFCVYLMLFLCLLNLKVLKNGVLEGSRLDFGGPGVRFWRLRAQFFHHFRMFLAECAENLPRFCPACGRLSSIATLLWPRTVGPRSSEGGWGGGGPPLGVFNPPATAGVPSAC